jgi:hypothetical protein
LLRKDGSGIALFTAGVWKLRGTRNGLEKARWVLFNEEAEAVHIILKYLETTTVANASLSRNWLTINEEIVHKKIVNCTNTLKIRNISSYLYRIKCKWENIIWELHLVSE